MQARNGVDRHPGTVGISFRASRYRPQTIAPQAFLDCPSATAVLRIAFQNDTAGTNLQLCAGTVDQFSLGTFSRVLSGSGGPGFQFLTIVDTKVLQGLAIYVIREVGSAASHFTINIE
jgi:hypothetical protein